MACDGSSRRVGRYHGFLLLPCVVYKIRPMCYNFIKKEVTTFCLSPTLHTVTCVAECAIVDVLDYGTNAVQSAALKEDLPTSDFSGPFKYGKIVRERSVL